MNNKAYDALKFVALILLPGAAAVYVGVAAIWGLPNADEVSQTVVVVDTFLGLLVRYFSGKHQDEKEYDGTLELQLDSSGAVRGAVQSFDVDPDDLAGHTELVFKVNPVTMDYDEAPGSEV
jgi:hypothetical protein